MLIHANRDELLRLSKQVALAVPETTEIIDLRGIHMEADARRSMLTLTATNQEIAIQTSMSAVVEQAGSIVIDAKLLPSLLSRLPEETLDIQWTAHGLFWNSQIPAGRIVRRKISHAGAALPG